MKPVAITYFLYTYNDIPEAVLVVLEVTSLRWFLASLHKAVLLGFLRIFVWSPTHLPTVGPATSVTSNANCIRCLVPAIVQRAIARVWTTRELFFWRARIFAGEDSSDPEKGKNNVCYTQKATTTKTASSRNQKAPIFTSRDNSHTVLFVSLTFL